MHISKKIKKYFVLGAVATMLISLAPIGIAHQTVSAIEEQRITTMDPIDLKRLIITPIVPDFGLIGEDTTITLDVNWVQDPDIVNVLGFQGTISGDGVFVSMGVPADFQLLEGGKRLNYINDRDGGYSSIPLVVKGNTEGVVTITGNLVYVDTTMTEELTKPITISIEMIDGAKLALAKENAKKEIDALANLSPEEKNTFKDQVDQGQTIPEVNKAVTDAKNKDAENLALAKEAGKKEINGLENLSLEEKAGFNQQIDGATTIPEIDEIVANAKSKNDENNTSSLLEAKENAKKEIEALKNLSPAEKEGFKNQVDVATTIPGINQAVTDAKNQDAANLAAAKEAGKKEIDGLTNLTPEEKTGFKNEIDAAKTIPEVEEIVARAKEKSAENAHNKELEQAKDDAKKEIDDLANLSPEEKEAIKEEIDDSKTKDKINNIVAESKEKDEQKAKEKELEQAKEDAKKEIDDLANLSPEEKEVYKEQIDDSKTKDKINNIVGEAKEKDAENLKAKELEAAKDAAKKEIEALENLTPAEKDAYKEQIDNSKTKDKINHIVDEAKEKDADNLKAKELEAAKDAAKKEIDALQNLSPAEKDAFKKEVDNAKTIEKVNDVKNAAKEKDALNLSTAKDAAKKEIDGLENLSDKDKTDFKAQIDQAQTIPEVQEILENAKAKDKEQSVVLGDVNDDGKVSFIDILMLKRYSLDEVVPETLNKTRFLKAADINKDGKVSLIDYMLLKRLVLGQ